MPRSTRKRKSGGRNENLCSGDGLSDVSTGVLQKAEGMRGQLAAKAQEMQTMASQEAAQASAAAGEKARQMDASLGNVEAEAVANA